MTSPQEIVDSTVAAAKTAAIILPKTTEQIDKFGQDIAKTMRFLLFPFQIGGALQDRLERYIDRAIRNVSEDQRIEPIESIAYPIVEKLRFQTEHDPITELYIQLLSRAMDRERVGEAHPAFFNIITQLAPDELIFLRDFEKRDGTMIMTYSGQKIYPNKLDRTSRLDKCNLSPEVRKLIDDQIFYYESLADPEMFPVYQEHLEHLGLIEYHMHLAMSYDALRPHRYENDTEMSIFSMRLTHFGRLFLKACTSSKS